MAVHPINEDTFNQKCQHHDSAKKSQGITNFSEKHPLGIIDFYTIVMLNIQELLRCFSLDHWKYWTSGNHDPLGEYFSFFTDINNNNTNKATPEKHTPCLVSNNHRWDVSNQSLPADTGHRFQCSSVPWGLWPSYEHTSCPSCRHHTWRKVCEFSKWKTSKTLANFLMWLLQFTVLGGECADHVLGRAQ